MTGRHRMCSQCTPNSNCSAVKLQLQLTLPAVGNVAWWQSPTVPCILKGLSKRTGACAQKVHRCRLTDELTDHTTDDLTGHLYTLGAQLPNSIITFAWHKGTNKHTGAPFSQFYVSAPASLMHSPCVLPRRGFGTCWGHVATGTRGLVRRYRMIKRTIPPNKL